MAKRKSDPNFFGGGMFGNLGDVGFPTMESENFGKRNSRRSSASNNPMGFSMGDIGSDHPTKKSSGRQSSSPNIATDLQNIAGFFGAGKKPQQQSNPNIVNHKGKTYVADESGNLIPLKTYNARMAKKQPQQQNNMNNLIGNIRQRFKDRDEKKKAKIKQELADYSERNLKIIEESKFKRSQPNASVIESKREIAQVKFGFIVTYDGGSSERVIEPTYERAKSMQRKYQASIGSGVQSVSDITYF